MTRILMKEKVLRHNRKHQFIEALLRWSMNPQATVSFTVFFYCERNGSGKCHLQEKPRVPEQECCEEQQQNTWNQEPQYFGEL